jgi:Icc-related predicted phosphoesterase
LNKIKVAAVGDVHTKKSSTGTLRPHFAAIQKQADILILCGDLTDNGLPEEMEVLMKELAEVKIPICAVLGNHDHEHNKCEDLIRIMTEAGVNYIDGSTYTIDSDVGFVGAKGFGGGYENATLQAWGEGTLKSFVYETINESIKIETGLSKLDTERKVVVLHYSPIKATLIGENPEIFAFLGSSRLSDPIDHFGADLVLHGHAHHGTAEGTTKGGVPVYNVSLNILTKREPPQHFAVFEI